MHRILSRLSVPCLLVLLSASFAHADVRLPGFYGDHMVLQRDKPLRLRGWADPQEKVTVTFGDATQSTSADANGHWTVTLAAQDASKTPMELTVAGKNSITLKDILVGEVWLCSGQSNMEWTVARSSNAKAEIAAAKYPLIRHMKVQRKPNNVPQDNLTTKWELCSPATAGNFTACGYFMARKLLNELDVPIGLVNSSWGGTRVEPWTPPVGFQNVPALKDIFQSVRSRTPGTPQYKAALTAHIDKLQQWVTQAKKSLSTTDLISPSPAFPGQIAPFKSHQDPTMLYNGMIHALVGFPIRGAIWYQGESNHSEGMLYFEKKKALIQGWRKLWEQGDFPFYYVQIAPFKYGNEDPTILAKFWEAQAAVQELPNTGMVVINDIATLNDIHPPNKQDVGLRLAQLALRNDYGQKDLVANSPEVADVQTDGSRLVVAFDNTGGGLKTRDGKAPTHFEIIDKQSGGFQPATASIDGDKVILTSDKVKLPTAFRFAWHKLAEPNLTGGTGLPVGAVRGGNVPKFADTLPLGREYKLVYDLDLLKLGRRINYSVDNSRSIGEFDRVGYFVELDERQVFVTMNAFTKDAKKLAIPTAASGAKFQQPVKSMDVYSSVGNISSGRDMNSGNMEFWPHNYGPQNSASVPGASGNQYDFGDVPSEPVDGYGCMQIHNHAAKQTLFAINHWGTGRSADLGIGNSDGPHRDWTFKGNASAYSNARLRVYVRLVN